MFTRSSNVFDESTAFHVGKILWYILFTERIVFEVIAVKYAMNVQPSKRLYFWCITIVIHILSHCFVLIDNIVCRKKNTRPSAHKQCLRNFKALLYKNVCT